MSTLKLIDVCEFIADCPHYTARDEGAGYPIVRTPNIGKGRLLLDNVQRVSKEVYEQRNRRAIPQTNDIIFAREAPAGNAALILHNQKVCLGQRTVLIRPNISKVVPSFLVYYILAPQQQYNLLGTANGATVAHINIPIIKDLPIELPNIEKQQRIGDILSRYDTLIENNQRQIKLLEEAAQRLYKEWFVDMHFPGYETALFVDGLPKGWNKTILGELSNFKRGKTITKDEAIVGNIPVVAGGLGPAYYCNKSNTENRVITISGSGANAGFTRLYFERIWASDCSYVDSSMTDSLFFTYCFLKDNNIKIKNLQKGAAQPHVYAKDINVLNLVLPSKTIINQFNTLVTPYYEKIADLVQQIKFLTESRDLLLPRLMSGELQVNP